MWLTRCQLQNGLCLDVHFFAWVSLSCLVHLVTVRMRTMWSTHFLPCLQFGRPCIVAARPLVTSGFLSSRIHHSKMPAWSSASVLALSDSRKRSHRRSHHKCQPGSRPRQRP